MIHKLKDQHVSFLPYVESPEIRSALRPDLQALQAPVWNVSNYSELLPCVVAEIWHSFTERAVAVAVNGERARRLEAELELEKRRNEAGGSVFTASEEKDFAFIWHALDRYEKAVYALTRIDRAIGEHVAVESYSFSFHVGSLVVACASQHHFTYEDFYVSCTLQESLKEALPDPKKRGKEFQLTCTEIPQFEDELMMFGLLCQSQTAESSLLGRLGELRARYKYTYSDKMARIRYWLAYSGKLPDKIEWEAEPDAAQDGESAHAPSPPVS